MNAISSILFHLRAQIRTLSCVLAAGGALLAPPRAAATLGEKEDSIEIVRAHLQANAARPATEAQFTVHELSTQRVQVREYVNSSGRVFAVSWHGRTGPNLRLLLGRYFADFDSAVHRRSGVHTQRLQPSYQVSGERVVVVQGGHFQNVHGLAIAPSLVPPGVSLGSLL